VARKIKGESSSIENDRNRHPHEVCGCRLGNRSALDGFSTKYKGKKRKVPTIHEKFNTYRFADYKEKGIELLIRITTVSVTTVDIGRSMKEVLR
jgi:predicted helicase